MKFLSTLKAERSIAQLMAERDVQAPEAQKAIDSLRKLGPSVIPQLIEAMGSAEKDHMSALAQTLATQVTAVTLKEVMAGLANGNARCVAGTALALANATNYDPNQLLEYLGKEDYAVSALIDVLR